MAIKLCHGRGRSLLLAAVAAPNDSYAEDWMGTLFNSMDFVRRKLERADEVNEPRVPWNVTKGERTRRERVVARMRIDPAFAEFTPEAQEKFIRAALTDNWDPVLPRLPRMGPET